MLHVGFRAMHESMTSQKIKKLGAGGAKLGGGQNFWWGGHGPRPPAGYGYAFGSVNRMKLLYKLRNNYGISHRLFLYLVSFLFSRKARVTVNTLIGDWIESEYGTSAGTILVALLFIAYVQDMPICIHLKFADDLVGFRSAKDVATVEESLQRILNELSAWSVEWDMQLNITNTKVVLF